MTNISHFVGLDVHKDSITIAVAAADRHAAHTLGTIPNDTNKLLKKLDKLATRSSISVCYEAGPTGYGLHRFLESRGIDSSVVAPTLIPKKAGDRVKTDTRDAKKLAHFHRSGDLTPVWVPDAQVEALRDLVRAREAAKADERAARHRLSKFLLRHDRRYAGKTSWTGMHLDWIRGQKFEHPAHAPVLREYICAVEEVTGRIKRLDQDIQDEAETSSLWPLIHSLQALKGIRLLTAAVIATELGDLQRFKNAGQLMSFLGLVGSENSTGESIRRGRITKTGNARVRRVLVESAWAYRFQPKLSRELALRSKEIDCDIRAIAWKAQHRLNRRYRRFIHRGKRPQITIIAIARELAGFVWSVGQKVTLPAH